MCQSLEEHYFVFPTSHIATPKWSPVPFLAFSRAVLRRCDGGLIGRLLGEYFVMSKKEKLLTPLRISWMSSLELWFSDLSMHQGYLEDLLKQIAGLHSQSFWFSMGWGLRMPISNKFLGPHMETHCSSLQNGYDNIWSHSSLRLLESS